LCIPAVTSDDVKYRNKINCKVIEINKGDVLVFRADLVHAGSDYDEENIRLHLYLDSPYVKREPNKTWVIAESYNTNEKLKDIIIHKN
jgi:ectoine hydroxylase-related dioxygenase (phytanoyl-CoA dioxygenase family)